MRFSASTLLTLATAAAAPIVAQINDANDLSLKAREASFNAADLNLEAREALEAYIKAREPKPGLKEINVESRDIEEEFKARNIEKELKARGPVDSYKCRARICIEAYRIYTLGRQGYDRCQALCTLFVYKSNHFALSNCVNHICSLFIEAGNRQERCISVCFDLYDRQQSND